MLDRHEAQDGQNGRDPQHRDLAGDSSLAERPMADREVPVPGTASASSTTLHQWLDGDLSESEARVADAKHVEFWSRMAVETDARRRMKTPTHVAAQIMAALPEREVPITAHGANVMPKRSGRAATSAVMVLGAGALTIGLAVGKFFNR
ncbi:MAG: hypothetical protein V4617_17345 [Gemmatimonadota bacterium]